MRGPRPPGRLPLAPSSGHAAASGPWGSPAPSSSEDGQEDLCLGTPLTLSDLFWGDADRGMFQWTPGLGPWVDVASTWRFRPHAGRRGRGLGRDSRLGPRQLFET